MSDFHIAHEVKRVEVMLKHRGFKVDLATRAEEVEGETE